MRPDDPVVEVDGLEVHFPVRSGTFRRSSEVIRAVDGVSFEIGRNETLGLVGESGSGKTTVGRSMLRAIEPTGGSLTYHTDDGDFDLRSLDRKGLRSFRRHAQMIFQDPYSSLNARMPVRDIIAEPLVALGLASGSEVDDRVAAIARRCKIDPAHLRRYPHAFSGGQRQRIGIARALVSEPSFVVADEAVSALDVSIQAEILNLLSDLQEEFGLAMLFIAHDLSVVAHLSHRVAVLYLGQIVELADTDELFERPRHPYTEALLSAIPSVDPDHEMERIPLEGEMPSPAAPPSGCRFHPRCPYATERCRTETPTWTEIDGRPGSGVRCHLVDDLRLRGAR